MKKLLILSLLFSLSALYTADDEKAKLQKLELTPESIAYWQNAMTNEYMPVIEETGFSKTSGLSGVFCRMNERTAQTMYEDAQVQQRAVVMWKNTETDPAYIYLKKLADVMKERNYEDLEMIKLSLNALVIQARKDIQLGMNQKGCYVRLPDIQDLNYFLSLSNDKEGMIALFEGNKEFSADDEEKNLLVQASALAQCYSTQEALKTLPEKIAISAALNTLIE